MSPYVRRISDLTFMTTRRVTTDGTHLGVSKLSLNVDRYTTNLPS